MIIDHPGWVAIQNHFAKHAEGYIEALYALAIAWVCTIPEKFPTTVQEWWAWFRNCFQTAVPAARAQHPTMTVTTPTSTVVASTSGVSSTTPEAKVTVEPDPTKEHL